MFSVIKLLFDSGTVVSDNSMILGSTKSDIDIEKELIKLVRADIGPVAAFKKVIVLPSLPKVCLL